MKKIMIVPLPILFVLHFSSCNDSSAEESIAKGEASRNKTGDANLITFKVNDQLVKTTGWTISRFKLTTDSKESLNITTDMHIEKRTLNVNLDGAEPGTYTTKGDPASSRHFYGSYYPDYMHDLATSYSFETGRVTITEFDTVRNTVNGFFSGVVKNLKGESFNITDGKIVDGRLTPGVTRYE